MVDVHNPLMYCPAEQLDVQVVQAPAPEPALYVPAAHVTQVGVAVTVHEPLRYWPAGQVAVQAVQLV